MGSEIKYTAEPKPARSEPSVYLALSHTLILTTLAESLKRPVSEMQGQKYALKITTGSLWQLLESKSAVSKQSSQVENLREFSLKKPNCPTDWDPRKRY